MAAELPVGGAPAEPPAGAVAAPGVVSAPGAATLDPTAAAAADPADAGAGGRLRLPFAARFQGLLIVVLLVGLVLIAQQESVGLYKVGLPMLVVAAFLQIAFGNIPPRANLRRSLALLALTWAIVAVLFYVSVQLAPTLIDATRNTAGS